MHEKIRAFLEKGILLSPDLLSKKLDIRLGILPENRPLVLDRVFIDAIDDTDRDWTGYDQKKADYENGKIEERELLGFLRKENTVEKKAQPSISEAKVDISENYEEKNVKITLKDFVSLYNNRYLMLQALLRQRQELAGSMAIRKVYTTEENETVSFIGMILEIGLTKNGHYMLTMEDQTGTIKTLISKNNKDLFTMAKDLTPDEVIGVQGTKGDKIVFAKSVIMPDIPLTKELKKSPFDEAALFISDIHIGSKAFLRAGFERLIAWLKGSEGSETQKELSEKIKYLFIIGDLVEGIGIYPGQENDLEIKDIYEQYNLFTSYMKEVPRHIKIIISPGNHDTLRIAEPQPPIPQELVSELYKMENVHIVSSPSTIRICESGGFSGFDVLIYHGFSFPYYGDAVESLRMAGGLESTENIMLYLLKKRHLAPTHGSTQYQLGYSKDPLVIKNVPDFFVSGHIHRASIKTYRNVTMLNCACWIAQTEYQEKRGLVPQPCRAIYIDLKTRESRILNFSDE